MTSPLDPPRTDPTVVVLLTHEPLDVAAAHDGVLHPQSGGVGLFSGVVRDHHEGAAVDHLVYEAWEERAEAAMRDVAEAVVTDFPGVRRVHVAHRLGPLAVGEVSVVCAASAPHRHEAIAAAQALIDRVKATVPIWKQELLADGDARWPGTDTP